MIKPMLATTLEKSNIVRWTDWRIEEKFDGHRVIVVIGTTVTAYGRPRHHAGSAEKTQAIKALPPHLEEVLTRLGPGVYDGELVGGDTSTDVTRLDLRDSLRLVVFDVLEYAGRSTAGDPYDDRRARLERLFWKHRPHEEVLKLAESNELTEQRDVTRFCERVWKRGGEGAILKRRTSTYQAGKRSKDWIKVKKLQTAVMTIVGFELSRGAVRFPGHPFAIVIVRDADGHETTVKTKDDAELAAFEKAYAGEWKMMNGQRMLMNGHHPHPAVGRKLRIEYQDRTRDGGYRHPRWDRWEDE